LGLLEENPLVGSGKANILEKRDKDDLKRPSSVVNERVFDCE